MKALLIIDLQRDFCPGGPLAVPGGDEIVPLINRLEEMFDIVAATKDWHPPGHISFAGTHGKQPGEKARIDGLDQVLWPDHCIQGSSGAEFEARLDTGRIDAVICKGEDPRIDSYSGFFDNGRKKATGLDGFLKSRNVDTVYICGLALDFCVFYTAMDAVRLGYKTFLLADACRGLDVDGSLGRAMEAMKDGGVQIISSTEVFSGRIS